MNEKMKQIVIDYLNRVDETFIKFSENGDYVHFWCNDEKTGDYTQNIINEIIPFKTIEEKKQIIADYILNNGLGSLKGHIINDIYKEIKVDSFIQKKESYNKSYKINLKEFNYAETKKIKEGSIKLNDTTIYGFYTDNFFYYAIGYSYYYIDKK